MVRVKKYNCYKAYQYLEAGKDYKEFRLSKGLGRVPPYFIPLSNCEEERFEQFVEENLVISLHEHPVLWPDDMSQAMEMQRTFWRLSKTREILSGSVRSPKLYEEIINSRSAFLSSRKESIILRWFSTIRFIPEIVLVSRDVLK